MNHSLLDGVTKGPLFPEHALLQLAGISKSSKKSAIWILLSTVAIHCCLHCFDLSLVCGSFMFFENRSNSTQLQSLETTAKVKGQCGCIIYYLTYVTTVQQFGVTFPRFPWKHTWNEFEEKISSSTRLDIIHFNWNNNDVPQTLLSSKNSVPGKQGHFWPQPF